MGLDGFDHLKCLNLERSLKKRLSEGKNFARAVFAARKNSRGGLWLIGGSVFRRLANILYGIPVPPETDFDFLVGELTEAVEAPAGWTAERNHFGNPKLNGPDFQVDLCPLAKVHSIVRRGLTPSIWNWETGTPLNIQAAAFDCGTCELIGETGIRAALAQMVCVNDPVQADYHARRKERPIAAIIRGYAAELNYSWELPEDP